MSVPAPVLVRAKAPLSEPTVDSWAPPTVRVAAVAEALVTAPRPAKRATPSALPFRSSVAFASIRTDAADGRPAATPMRTVPAETCSVPVSAETAFKESTPAPDLFQVPAPARPDAKATSLAPRSRPAVRPAATGARRAERSAVCAPDQLKVALPWKVIGPEPSAPELKASVPPARRTPPVNVPAPESVSRPAPDFVRPWAPARSAVNARSVATSRPRKEPEAKLPEASAATTSVWLTASAKETVAPEAADQRPAVASPFREAVVATRSSPAATVVWPLKPAESPERTRRPAPTLVKAPLPARPPASRPEATSRTPAPTVVRPARSAAPSRRTEPTPVLESAPTPVVAPATVRVMPVGTSSTPPVAVTVRPRSAESENDEVTRRPPPAKARLSASKLLGTSPKAASIATETRPPAKTEPPR